MRQSRIQTVLLALCLATGVTACSEDSPTDSNELCQSNADCTETNEVCGAEGLCVVVNTNPPDIRDDSAADVAPEVAEDADSANPDVEVVDDTQDVGDSEEIDGAEDADDSTDTEDTDDVADVADTDDVVDTEDTSDVADVADTDDAVDTEDTSDVADVADTDDGDGGEDWTMPPRPATEPPPADASWRYGGGVGYPDQVDPTWPVVTVVSTASELLDAVDAAIAGDIIYVEDDARIDMTDKRFCMPGGVWLASGRGLNGSAGALLYSNEIERPLISICGDDVRITGLRVYGFDSNECPAEWPNSCERPGGDGCRDCTSQSIAIQSKGFDGLEVDNTELAGWSYAGVWVAEAGNHKIHHNDIHHIQRQGLGYGVVLTGNESQLVTADIAYNRFDYIRHAIAGSGGPGQDYVARYNLMGENSIGHIFDMHGEGEGGNASSRAAGGLINIYGNTVLCDDETTMLIRGIPDHGAYLHDNCLSVANAAAAVRQTRYSGRVYADRSPTGSSPNRYGRSAAQCETIRWCVAAGGEGPWRYLSARSGARSSLGFGDFDGDGKTDVFRSSDGEWQYSPGGSGDWVTLNGSTYPLSALRFGDFDGDGVTDVFRANGSEFQWSRGGMEQWVTLNNSGTTSDDLAFGDFDGDGKTDAFRTTGSEWQWSSGASEPWTQLNNSGTQLGSLAFGDFDGDGKTDVFQTSGGKWQYTTGGTGGWIDLNSSGYPLSALRFGDFNGDGVTDAFRISSSRVLVSWSANSGWETLRIGSWSFADMALGDFDGDGITDVFSTGCL